MTTRLSAARPCRVLVADGDVFLAGLAVHVLSEAGHRTETAHDSHEAYHLAENFKPDVALVDLVLGDGPTGMDLAHTLNHHMPHIALVMTGTKGLAVGTDSEPPAGVWVFDKAGITQTQMLLQIVDDCLSGAVPHQRGRSSPFSGLTASQSAVLRMIAQGYSNDAIAERRNSTTSAVEQLVGGLYRSLGINGNPDIVCRTEAVRLYVNAFGPTSRPAASSAQGISIERT